MDHRFFDVLFSAQRHADMPAEEALFEPLIGSWDLRVKWFNEQGAVTREENGEWHFAWVLEGRAIQDVWIVPPRRERAGRSDLYEYGTSVRFRDLQSGGWKSTWLGPMRGAVVTFSARKVDDGIMMETKEADGRRMRWSFSEITNNSFRWRNHIETDSGWLLQQEFAASRAGQT